MVGKSGASWAFILTQEADFMDNPDKPTEAQQAEIQRLTEKLLAKAARLKIKVVPHSEIVHGKVIVYGFDFSQPMDSPGRIVYQD